MATLPNIEYKKPIKNPTIDSESSMFDLPFYKDIEYLANLDNFVSFIKAVEQMVRTSKYYARYIKYLKEEIGLNFCQVLSNIQVDDPKANTKIEMHHGPILTLFDYAAIITDDRLAKGKNINTFIITDILLEEHFKNNIQVVMLSETVHQLVHDGKVFLNTKHAFGDLNAFLKKYPDGVSDEYMNKINKYIERCDKYESNDRGALDLSDEMITWSKIKK